MFLRGRRVTPCMFSRACRFGETLSLSLPISRVTPCRMIFGTENRYISTTEKARAEHYCPTRSSSEFCSAGPAYRDNRSYCKAQWGRDQGYRKPGECCSRACHFLLESLPGARASFEACALCRHLGVSTKLCRRYRLLP